MVKRQMDASLLMIIMHLLFAFNSCQQNEDNIDLKCYIWT